MGTQKEKKEQKEKIGGKRRKKMTASPELELFMEGGGVACAPTVRPLQPKRLIGSCRRSRRAKPRTTGAATAHGRCRRRGWNHRNARSARSAEGSSGWRV